MVTTGVVVDVVVVVVETVVEAVGVTGAKVGGGINGVGVVTIGSTGVVIIDPPFNVVYKLVGKLRIPSPVCEVAPPIISNQ